MKNGLIEDLRRNIYELMKKNNMTCQKFADALDYSISDVDRILFGEVLLPPVEIERIANLFGLTKRELIYYQEELEACHFSGVSVHDAIKNNENKIKLHTVLVCQQLIMEEMAAIGGQLEDGSFVLGVDRKHIDKVFEKLIKEYSL